LKTHGDREERLKDVIAGMIDDMIVEFIEKAHEDP
jgi:hypothetical protein